MGYARANIDLSLKTVIATQTICTFPLVTAIVAAQLFRFQRVQEEAAIDLGCSRLQVLRHIILPHIAPALTAAAIFAFTWSFNNYEISAFTIGFQQTFPIWVYSSVRNPDHTAVVNAISALISVVQVLLIYVAIRLSRSRGGAGAIAMTEMPRATQEGQARWRRSPLPLPMPAVARGKRATTRPRRVRHPVRTGHAPDRALPVPLAGHDPDEHREVPAEHCQRVHPAALRRRIDERPQRRISPGRPCSSGRRPW